MSDQSTDRDFGNEQDMPVADKPNPVLGPTEASQDEGSLPVQLVPMGSYNDPNNPIAVSGSVNLSVNDHPVQHAEDYGADILGERGHDDVQNPMSAAALSLREFDLSQTGDVNAAAARAMSEFPDDRDQWSKGNWQAAARAYSLPVSGNLDTLRERVEEHERVQSLSPDERSAEERAQEVEDAKALKAGDWKAQVEAAQDAKALDDLESLYKESEADFSTVNDAFEARRAELSGESA